MTIHPARARLAGASLLALAIPTLALAEPDPASAPAAPAGPQTTPSSIAEGSDVVVTGTRANQIAPVTASLRTTQPQSVISRSFIEDSLPSTADFNQIALLAPSVSNFSGNNGVGLSESKAQIRGFQDGEYNITYDGIPFGDTNDPTHHSNTFFPSNTIETLIVDRGPGNASQLGQATFGGNINMFSRTARPVAGVEGKVSYGTFDTLLARGLVQSGAVNALGGTEFVATGQYLRTDGRLTYSAYNQKNIFVKAAVPIGPDVRLTLLATLNRNNFHQPDSDGATLAQVNAYGINYSLNNDPTNQNYYRYNDTTKKTDFEIVRLEATLAPHTTFDNSAYTYFYDNETLSGNDNTTLQGPTTTVTTATGAKVTGVPGYTKTNKYRVYGDIAKLHLDFGFGSLLAGAWIEHADTFRQQTDVDLTTGNFDYREKKVVNPLTGEVTPNYVRFNQNSFINHTEEFAELEIRPLPGLRITPGVKHVDLNRKVDAIYNQTTRYAQALSQTYTKTLPFATINYAITPALSVYGQYAKGFLTPSLSVLYINNPGLSTVKPQTSTNYQAGAVFAGEHLSLDADVYLIKFADKIASELVPNGTGGTDTAFYNQGGVLYKGVEGEVTYAFRRGLALFANGSLNYAKENVTHIQIAKAPKSTAAGGVIARLAGVRFSLIDKWTGPQYVISETFNQTTGLNTLNRMVRIAPYNTAVLSASYDLGHIRFGLEVTDLLDSTRVNNLSLKGSTPATTDIGYPGAVAGDLFYFQPGRQITGDVTVRF